MTVPGPGAGRGRSAGPARAGRGLLAAAICAALLAPLAACSGSGGGRLVISGSDCAGGWKPATGGVQQVSVYNGAGFGMRVQVVAAGKTAVYAQIATLAPGTTRTLQLRLPDGAYSWVCTPLEEGHPPVTSPAVTVRGSSASATPVQPLTAAEQQALSRAYVMRLVLQMSELLPAVTTLQDRVRAGDLAAARSQWLTAHLQFAALGGAYGNVVPSLWPRLDGLPDALPGGVHDPAFTGFHRLEYLLWQHGSRADLLAAAATLVADLTELRDRVQTTLVPAADLVRQGHEILERSLQVEFTGASDLGSGSGLATMAANVSGTEVVLGLLASALTTRDPELLARLQSELAALADELAGLRRADGTWPAPGQLDRPRREHLQASLGSLLERLALLPTVLPVPTSNPD